ncbi:hypothetical protein SteCoe_29694 [Stentor coeruleus]|uniref:Uncharacterized protein n=1 Tax=Stentor coeruleus TaxID=5963 RepID=A0A1R2B5Q5_9CILI|nr:hypothetical protein SteCoe_29694 [Stentor coeruleus]
MISKYNFCPETHPRIELHFLEHFSTSKAKNAKPPKKEYLRCKLIRGHKRAIRQLTKGIIPTATLHKFDIKNSKALSIWEKMKKIYDDNIQFFVHLSKTEAGPKTDGKARRQVISESIPKSFNNNFCSEYFQPECVRESFYYYVLLIYAKFDAGLLIEKFQFFCCKDDDHSVKCIDKWMMLKDYITIFMFTELNLTPYKENTELISLPDYKKFIILEDVFVDKKCNKSNTDETLMND